jgi:hypothetical protein
MQFKGQHNLSQTCATRGTGDIMPSWTVASRKHNYEFLSHGSFFKFVKK